MNYPQIPTASLLKKLEPPKGRVRMVLDTDTYNEVDDQFALAYAIKSSEKIDLEAIYAAPFHNHRSSGPAEGMELSFQEIHKVLEALGCAGQYPVFKGSTKFLRSAEELEESEAVKDLIDRALKSDEDDPLYVVATGAATNIANAILLEPRIIEKIVLVWLGGHAFHWPDSFEFNMRQDVFSARVLFDCGVPLIHIPCRGVTTHLLTTLPELEAYLGGKSAIGDYLIEIARGYTDDHFGWSKVIWDVAAIAWLLDGSWVPTNIIASPIVTDQVTWSFDPTRHLIRSARFVDRDKIFADLFRKLVD